MTEVSTIGLDLAKNVFQVHGVDVSGETVIRRQLRRRQVVPFFRKQPACLVGIEACATSHHWARELGALGHEVRIMPAAYVKPYVKRNKNDAADTVRSLSGLAARTRGAVPKTSSRLAASAAASPPAWCPDSSSWRSSRSSTASRPACRNRA